ncbi:MAG: hypothetical protein MI924_35665 [Chloroflexales bacterium]|nr:hypothetical protein [Chloroflexales bacterium]
MMSKGMIRVLLAALFFILLANTTFAAPPTTNTLNKHIVSQPIESEADVGLTVVYAIEDTIQPGHTHTFGPFYLNANDPITISITFTPTNGTVYLGYCIEDKSWCVWGNAHTGGVASDTFHVPHSGQFNPAIYNDGSEAVLYKGHIEI